MGMSATKTYLAAVDEIWGTVLKIVSESGYPIARTDQAAKQIVYRASGGGWAWEQEVTVSMSGVGDGKTLVTVFVQSAGQATFTEGGQQSKLINFMLDELGKSFRLDATPIQKTTAPGTPGNSGCAVSVLFIMSAVTVITAASLLNAG